jgi:hypothetical protein
MTCKYQWTLDEPEPIEALETTGTEETEAIEGREILNRTGAENTPKDTLPHLTLKTAKHALIVESLATLLENAQTD